MSSLKAMTSVLILASYGCHPRDDIRNLLYPISKIIFKQIQKLFIVLPPYSGKFLFYIDKSLQVCFDMKTMTTIS